jgi:structural maintenance of chromosome 3 (chondroitin sulfate proteoglycan 6)
LRLQEVLALIEERLGELEREKAELTEYEELDKERRALDNSLYEQQCSKVTASVS